MSATAADRPHILVYPFTFPGHIIPLIDLTERLINRGVAVTFLITPPNLPLLRPLLSRHPPSILAALVVPAPVPYSSLGRQRPANRLIEWLLSMRDHHTPAILEWFASHPSPPVAIVSDFFLGWTHNLAIQLGIPRIVFSPSAAFALSVENSLWQNLPRNKHPKQDDGYVITLSDLPNAPSFPWSQLWRLYRLFIAGDHEMSFYKDGMLANVAGWGIVFNSFAELERPYMDHIEKSFGPGRVWAVGPLLPPPSAEGSPSNGISERGGSSSVAAEDIVNWLDGWEVNSVVYVCFGSRVVPNAEDCIALANALEMSGVGFVWCLRDYHLPEGFEDRTAGRGLIIRGWAPQVMILRHPAVGSFLTHCGWNSVLEGLAAGVVMLTWPMGADQYSDAKLLVDHLGVGIRAHERLDVPPNPTELSRILARSLDESIPERIRARELKEAAAAAVSPGGTSDKHLDAFVEALKDLRSERKQAGIHH